jgi:LacI family transcriptional regulator
MDPQFMTSRSRGKQPRQTGVVTIVDVARRAGVSLATASRAINGSPDRVVGEDLARRVTLAAQELGYAPNATAQAMVRGKTTVVGLIVHDIADPYFSTVAAAVMAEAEQHGLLVTISTTMRRHARELTYVEAFRRHAVRAVIIVGSRREGAEVNDRLADELASYEASGGRVVMVSQPLLPFDTIDIANAAGARQLATELCTLGYRRFCVLTGPADLLTSRDRLRGFHEGAVRGGRRIEAANIVQGDFTRDGGYASMTEVIRSDRRPDCVFAVNDVMAVGAIAAARDNGVRIPEDMAIAGFDDIVTLRDVGPPLTTVRVPLEEIGQTALQYTLDAPGDAPRLKTISTEVVIRDSTPIRTARTG